MILDHITIKDVKITLGKLCKHKRQTYKLSQEELAETLGLSRFTIQKFESGQNATLDTALKIAHHFDLLNQFYNAVQALASEENNESMY